MDIYFFPNYIYLLYTHYVYIVNIYGGEKTVQKCLSNKKVFHYYC